MYGKLTYLHSFLLLIVISSCSKLDISGDSYTIRLDDDAEIESVVFLDANRAVACGGITNDYGCIYLSVDGGTGWQKQFETEEKLYSVFQYTEDTVYAVGDSLTVLISTDAGMSWSDSISENFSGMWFWDRSNLRDIYIDIDYNICIGRKSSSFGNIYIADESNFNSPSSIQVDYSVNDLYYFNNDLYSAAYGAVFKLSPDADIDYCNLTDDNYTAFADNGTTLFCCGYNGSINRLNNESNNWEELIADNSVISTSRKHLLDIAFLDSNYGICVGEDGLIYETTDGGNEWVSCDLQTEKSLFGIGVSSADSSYYIGASEGTIIVYKKGH